MENKFAYRLSAAIMVVSAVVVLALTLRVRMLEKEKEDLYEQLHEVRADPARCAPVHVTCECPEYDEGWEDAQHAEGCEPQLEMSIDGLRIMCDDLDMYEYEPGC